VNRSTSPRWRRPSREAQRIPRPRIVVGFPLVHPEKMAVQERRNLWVQTPYSGTERIHNIELEFFGDRPDHLDLYKAVLDDLRAELEKFTAVEMRKWEQSFAWETPIDTGPTGRYFFYQLPPITRERNADRAAGASSAGPERPAGDDNRRDGDAPPERAAESDRAP
jgi:hypothetical protein